MLLTVSIARHGGGGGVGGKVLKGQSPTLPTPLFFSTRLLLAGKIGRHGGGGVVGEKCLKELIANLPTSLFTSFSLMASFQSFAKYKFYSAGR